MKKQIHGDNICDYEKEERRVNKQNCRKIFRKLKIDRTDMYSTCPKVKNSGFFILLIIHEPELVDISNAVRHGTAGLLTSSSKKYWIFSCC